MRKKRTFYQSKITKEIFDKKPPFYNTSKYREFNDSCNKHKKLLKQINNYLSNIETPQYLFSKKESDYKRNAIYHIGNTKFILLDIDSFFPHCKYDKVKDFFLKESGLNMIKKVKCSDGKIIRYETDVATNMAKLVTVPLSNFEKDRIIPQGYPTSSLISFFAYKEMFDKIFEISKKYNCRFSTYVDDISFSYNEYNFNPDELINEVRSVLKEYGHSLSDKKIKIIDIEKVLEPNEKLILPLITGLTVKRYKVRASKEMHSKMNKLFSKYNSCGEPVSPKEYIQKWKCFVSLVGIYNTIEYIEPSSTKERRKHIGDIISKNKNNYALQVNIKRVLAIKYENKIFYAYKNKTLQSFIKKNKAILIDYSKNKY